VILSAFALALGQLGDPAFRRVLGRGVLLALVGLAAASALVVWGAGVLLPDALSLPWIGEVAWLDDALGWALLPAALLLSVVLMIPVASAITSMFLDEVAEAVERRHYPRLPPVRPMPWAESLRDSAAFLGVILLANALAFALYLALPPLAPLIFLAVNGALLGREYVQLAARRRMDAAEARRFARAHGGTVWLAGALMALPLTVPVVNLLVPVLGAATFTHLVHRLDQGGRRR
jgi:uncharacterized protein involved in cysteine biosynthesis